MGLNNINSKSTWGQAASDINTNFTTIDSDLKKVKNATTRNKGYFSTSSELISAFPTASKGDIAYVGSSYPYDIWKWNGSSWANSGSTGGEESVNLGNYHTAEYVDEKLSELSEEISGLRTETDQKLSELGAEVYNLDVEINGGEKIHKIIQGNGTDIFIPLSDLRTTKFIVQHPSANFKQYGLATSTNGIDYIYANVNWSDESNGIGRISFPSGTTHIVVTHVNKSGTIISFLDVNKDGLSVLLEEEVESRKLEVNKIEDKIVTLSNEIYNANVEINGGRKIVKTILGNGTDIFIPLATLRTTDFVVKNPSANFKQYGLGLSSNGTNYVYKEITWLDESKGLGRIVFGSDTTHVVVTSAVKVGTELIFIDVADNSSLKKDLIKLNQRLFGGRIEVGKYEGNGTNIFINRTQSGLFDTKVYFYVKNPNAANFREYAFATSEDGLTLKLYQQVTWIDQAKGYGYITIDTDYLAISSAVKAGTQITFLSPNYNGECEIFAHDAIVSFIDDDTGRYVPEIWGEIIRQTGIKMGFACVTGVISGKVNALSDSYQPMTIDELRDLYNEGHEVYSHTWSHPACYSDDVTPTILQEEFRKSKDWLNENGFTRNSEVIVYSGGLGEEQTEKHNVARRHYKYGVDTVGGGINTEPLKNKLCIYRINADTFTLSELIAKVDKAVEEKKLLVLMNHAYELNKDKANQINKMISLINYIKTTNAIILPLHEALHQIYGW